MEERLNHKMTQCIYSLMSNLKKSVEQQIQSKLNLVIKDEVKIQQSKLNFCDMKLARAIANQEIDRRLNQLMEKQSKPLWCQAHNQVLS